MVASDNLLHLRGGEGCPDGAWSRIAVLAAGQHGAVARRQLRAAGLSDRQIDGGVHRGLLHRVHRGVFAMGHVRLSPLGRWSAAVLACGPDAALGYASAGAAWAIRPSSSPTVDVVVRTRSRPRHRGVRAHCHAALCADEVIVLDGIAVTTVARTLLDLAVVLPADALRKAVAAAEVLRLFDLRQVRRLLDRHPRHRGRRALERVLATWRAPDRVRSVLEDRFVALCERHRFPPPLMNSTEYGMEIDALFPDYGVAVELDGGIAHRGYVRREDDYARRVRLTAAWWTFFAFTYRQVTDDRGRFVVNALGPTLTRGAPRGAWP